MMATTARPRPRPLTMMPQAVMRARTRRAWIRTSPSPKYRNGKGGLREQKGFGTLRALRTRRALRRKGSVEPMSQVLWPTRSPGGMCQLAVPLLALPPSLPPLALPPSPPPPSPRKAKPMSYPRPLLYHKHLSSPLYLSSPRPHPRRLLSCGSAAGCPSTNLRGRPTSEPTRHFFLPWALPRARAHHNRRRLSPARKSPAPLSIPLAGLDGTQLLPWTRGSMSRQRPTPRLTTQKKAEEAQRPYLPRHLCLPAAMMHHLPQAMVFHQDTARRLSPTKVICLPPVTMALPQHLLQTSVPLAAVFLPVARNLLGRLCRRRL